MLPSEHSAKLNRVLSDADIMITNVEERAFPGERWLIIFVPEESLAVAQSLAGSMERILNQCVTGEAPYAVTFRPEVKAVSDRAEKKEGGRLAGVLLETGFEKE